MRDEKGDIVFPEFERRTFLLTGYTRQLDEYCEELEELVDELLEDLNRRDKKIHALELENAKAGNRLYQRDADRVGQKWHEINIQHGKQLKEGIEREARLQGEIDRLKALQEVTANKLKAEHEIEIEKVRAECAQKIREAREQLYGDELERERTMIAMRMQLQYAQAQVAALQEQLDFYQMEQPAPAVAQKNSKTGKFQSANGMTLIQKKELGLKMHLLGYKPEVIGKRLEVLPATAEKYIREEKALYSPERLEELRQYYREEESGMIPQEDEEQETRASIRVIG